MVLNELEGVFVVVCCGGRVPCWVACGLEGRCLERQSKRSAGVYHFCGKPGEKVPGSLKRAWG